MSADRAAALSGALAALRQYGAARERDPLSRFRGTPPQEALWRSPAKRRLLRTGNQVGGKTTAAIVEALWWATHQHPYRQTPTRAVQIWIVCVSWTQSLAIQSKLWALTPRRWLADGVEYDPETGFGTKSPVLTMRDGSQIWIKTGRQGGHALAGATVDLVIYDEPPVSQRTYSEVERRLTRSGGDLVLTMTPINARVDWIRDMAERGVLQDLHYRADPSMWVLADGTVLRDQAGRRMDAAWLAETRAACMAHEEPILVDGEWECRAIGQIFSAWDPSRMWVPSLLDSPMGPGQTPVRLLLGVDYGDDRLRTAAVLVAVAEHTEPGQVRCWVLGEYVPERSTTVDMDAEGIVAMLTARGLRWADLSGAYGDKRYTDARGRLTKKSNAMLEAAISKTIGMSGRATSPRVLSAKRGEGAGAGAVSASVRWMHERMLSPHGWLVDASCIRVKEALETWDGTDRHPRKDVLDGLRYALRYQWGWQRRRGVVPRVEVR